MTELRRLSSAAEWKATGDAGELEGYVSVFNNVDQGGDVVLPGAFKKTLADWSNARQPLPLIADHQLTTEGVIGSVVQAREDTYGLNVRARFSSIPKAQEIRTRMIEGHVRGMSFTYEPKRSHMGEKDGRRVRYLQEVRIFEATITPFPMNQLALASAKAGPDDFAADTERLARLERWVADAEARAARAFQVEHPEAVAYAARVSAEAKARHQLAALERWAASTPSRRLDPQQQAAELHRARRAKDNSYSLAMANWRASVVPCGHRSCLVGACKYRTAG
jgi:HK97 family phage prohead protease